MKPSPVKITLNPVKKSSQVHSIGYDPTSKTMAVKFNSGDQFHYRKDITFRARAVRRIQLAD